MTMKIRLNIHSILAMIVLCIALTAQARDIDISSWKGDFGELVQRLARRGQYRDWSKRKISDCQREAELLAAHGYVQEAIIKYERLLERNDDFKKEPLASETHSRIKELQAVIDQDNRKAPVFNVVLEQLDIPAGKCHIEETELPKIYRQDGEEKRMEFGPFLHPTSWKPMATNCCDLNFSSLYRFWHSENKEILAAVVYDFLGPFFIMSTDGGKSWGKPLYLGLHRLPDYTYMILSDSKLPLIEGDDILLEVTVWNRDRSKFGSPLTGYQYHWKKWNRMLRIPIAAVSLDTDEDGLTDLFEERILTNPYSQDTDRDGISDALDSQPLHQFPGTIKAPDYIFLALLGAERMLCTYFFSHQTMFMDLTSLDHESFQHNLTDAGIKYYTELSSQPISPFNTTFIAAERDALTHITGNQRFIVLNDVARMRYKQKFGNESEPGYATFTMIVNPDETKAYVNITYHQRGESFALESKLKKWHTESIESIIWD